MICARKIHDELNIFVGIFDNWVFLGVWVGIVAVQVIIVQFTSVVFEVHDNGLAWEQWLIAAAISLTVLIINFIVKFIPDRFTPQMGQDTPFNKREVAANRPQSTKFPTEK